MEKVKKCDARIVKTKRAIRDAFIKLLSEKPYEAITVKDVATVADVDRKTVYNYYGGVHDIRSEVENSLAAIIDDAKESLDGERISDYYDMFRMIAKTVTDNIELYEYLTLIDINSDITRKIVSVLHDWLCDVLRRVPVCDCDIDLISDCIISSAISACRYWFGSDRTRSLEQVMIETGRLVIGGVREFA